MEEKTVHVGGISCNHCVMTIQRELADVAGVKAVRADAASKEVTVQWESPATWDAINDMLNEIGYPAD